MAHFKSITILVLSVCAIAPSWPAEINVVSETIQLKPPNCAISDLRNEENRRAASESVRIKIVIENCSTPSISGSAFAHLNNIISIDIVNSSVNEIDANAFEALDALEQLTVTGNNLSTFREWSDLDLNGVTALDLHGNQIRELDVNALRPFWRLMYLSLADNLITDIPYGFFGKMSEILTLRLDGNIIQRIEEDTFKPLLQLEHLHLENNEIAFVDEYAFTTLAHLKTLRLDSNRITSLDSELFLASPRLQYLNLSHNSLYALAMEFQDNLELKEIDLSYNSLTALQSDTLEGVQSLEVFSVSHNQLRSIEPNAFADFVRVKKLDISHNQLTSIRDNQLAYLESIECLNLSNNFIESIQPFTFTDLRTLQSIDLSYNHLDSDIFVQKIASLKLLDLSANHYRSINITEFEGIEEVKLIGNLWSCSWLVTELVNLNVSIRDEIRFGYKLAGIDADAMGIRQPEEVVCYDDRNAAPDSNHLVQRHIVIVYAKEGDCRREEKKESLSVEARPKAFSELLSNEFDFKACLIWTVIAVFVVIGVVRLIKCCLDRSERRSERFRITQQEKVMKDIEDYFSRSNTERA